MGGAARAGFGRGGKGEDGRGGKGGVGRGGKGGVGRGGRAGFGRGGRAGSGGVAGRGWEGRQGGARRVEKDNSDGSRKFWGQGAGQHRRVPGGEPRERWAGTDPGRHPRDRLLRVLEKPKSVRALL